MLERLESMISNAIHGATRAFTGIASFLGEITSGREEAGVLPKTDERNEPFSDHQESRGSGVPFFSYMPSEEDRGFVSAIRNAEAKLAAEDRGGRSMEAGITKALNERSRGPRSIGSRGSRDMGMH